MKKYSLLLAFALLVSFLSGCGGLSGQIEKINHGRTLSHVYIKESANWDEKTEEEKFKLAQYAVQKCMDEKEDDAELTAVSGQYGGYPSRTVFYYDADDFPEISIDETTIEEYLKQRDQRLNALFSDTIPHVKSVQLFGVENTIAYYDVHITSSTAWNWNIAGEQDRIDLVARAIEVCAGKYVNDGAKLYEIMGYTEDGHVAFSWRGGATVKIYIDGKHDHEYTR